MLAVVFFIPLQVATARFLVSQSVLKVMYGDIGIATDLRLPPEARRADGGGIPLEMDSTYGTHEELPDFQEFLDEVEDMEQWHDKLNATVQSQDPDIKELCETSTTLRDLKNSLQDVVKEHKARRHLDMDLPHEVNELSADPVELREWYYQKLSLTYLIHIRFQVDSANRKKMAIQFYAGYKIGYLFHRLMRLKTLMYRIMEEYHDMKGLKFRGIQYRQNWRTRTHSLKMFLQLYERIQQLDVDVKDTVDAIKLQFWKRHMFVTQLDTTSANPLWK